MQNIKTNTNMYEIQKQMQINSQVCIQIKSSSNLAGFTSGSGASLFVEEIAARLKSV